MTITCPNDAAQQLRAGKAIDAELDVAVQALALTVPHLLRHIDPTSTDGRRTFANFRMLADKAGLPHDHPVLASWLILRALRVEAGNAVTDKTGCPVTKAFFDAIGVAPVVKDGIIIDSVEGDDRISLTSRAPDDNEQGAIATPAGTIRFPNSDAYSKSEDWGVALSTCEKASAIFSRRSYSQDPDAIVALDWTRPNHDLVVEADSIHEDWRPEIAYHEDLQKHPSDLVQSSTLATVIPPVSTYKPRLTRRVISSGCISDAQFEFLVAAGEAHSRFLPADPKDPGAEPQRVGIFLADGTGAGKSHEAHGVIMDNRLHGRRKAILIMEKRRHLGGFVAAWQAMGCDPKDFLPLWDLKPEDRIPNREGILVATYSMLREYNDQNNTYVRNVQISNWAGSEFEGPMIFDESQNMRNAAANDDRANGYSEISQQGLAGIDLQEILPGARVVYASATGATDVHNLGYATRLGLWGPETPFETRRHFISAFENGDIGDLEQVTLSLKASGLYIARSISYDGVDVVHLPLVLTREERNTYNDAAEMWKRLREMQQHCSALCGIKIEEGTSRNSSGRAVKISGKVPYSNLSGIYEANRKNALSTMIASFKAKGVIENAKKDIENGKSVVIQMQNTYEAQLNRALDRVEDPSAIRLEPAELLSFAEMIPTEKYKIVNEPAPTKDKPNATINVFRPVLDAQGNPVHDPQAEAIRAQMIAEARKVTIPLPPLDQFILAFGTAMVAEVTGRTKRIAPVDPNGARSGRSEVTVENRTEEDRLEDIEAFHAGKKTILIFSTGAGGSSLSYHAKIGTLAENRRRNHYLIQLGYRADQVTQGLGRTHRSDQTMPPIATLVTVDLPADRLYASRIISSLFKLGALTQGHRHATSNGMFDERDCLDGPYATKAWSALQGEISEGLIPNYTWLMFMQDMGLEADGSYKVNMWGKEKRVSIMSNPSKLINRVAALTDRRQQLIFDRLRELIDVQIETAISEGTFKSGPEVISAKSLEIVSQTNIKTDKIHGGTTRIMRIRRKTEAKTVSFGDAYKMHMQAKALGKLSNFCKHRTTGMVALILPGKPIETALGERWGTKEVVTPMGSTTRVNRLVDREPWMPASQMDVIESLWDAILASSSNETTNYLTLVTDALLPVWPLLTHTGAARNAVYRLSTDSGRQIVGRPIFGGYLPLLAAKMGGSYEASDAEVDDVIKQLENGGRVGLAAIGTNNAHTVSGSFSNGRLDGLSIETANERCSGMESASVLIGGSVIGAGARSTVSDAKNLKDDLRILLSHCPVLYHDDMTGQGASKSNPAQKAAQKIAIKAVLLAA